MFMYSQTTATHQLKTAMMSVAFAGRSILQSSTPDAKAQDVGGDVDDRMFLDLIGISLSNALLGMDANDPPKTLATMQLIGSIFSNVNSLTLKYFKHSLFKKLVSLSGFILACCRWLYWTILLMTYHS